MFLKSLVITSGNDIIRNIQFTKGLNLIVDETPTDIKNITQTGNNVGKTTVLRLIDFCLGGKAKNIYQDPEFKKQDNEEVRDFLIDDKVFITLTLQEELDNRNSAKVIIRRNFLSRNRKIIMINGKQFKGNDKELDDKLKEILFNFKEDKPTLRQIIAKNIRDEAERLSNTVKVLGNFGKREEYEALYLFWLGVPLAKAEQKRNLLEEKRIDDKILRRITDNGSESQLQQFLEVIYRNISSLEKKKENFNINNNYKQDFNKLNNIRSYLNKISTEISCLELRKELIEESKVGLEEDVVNINVKELEELYKKANVLIPNLQKSFEETVVFHNQMIEDKVKYITREVPLLVKRIELLKSKLSKLLEQEKEITSNLKISGALEDLEEIIVELNIQYENKGKYKEQLSQLKELNKNLADIEGKLDQIDIDIANLDPLVEDRVTNFNKFFSKISNNFYGEQFVLSADFEKEKKSNRRFYKLNIDTLSRRAGPGKKKGEILAFDLAYIKFADSMGLKCLHFILHDQMEAMHGNQIISLLNEISNTNCQLVIPILRGKLPKDLQNKKYEILSLSQGDKLFRI